jgi:hypothetical protein
MKFNQLRDVFMCDFVAMIEVCVMDFPPLVHTLEHQVQVWCIWGKSLVGAMNKPIIMHLVTNLNTNVGHLAFDVN